jgi:hypothetical protein
MTRSGFLPLARLSFVKKGILPVGTRVAVVGQNCGWQDMKINSRIFLVLTLSVMPGFLCAETLNEKGWSFSETFQGSSNAAGVVLKNDSMVAYSSIRTCRRMEECLFMLYGRPTWRS